ncbi:MAG TPA: flagellar hook capping FlgD N-terminal domain-containing protein [Caulobacteraceae bacterium]
MGTVANGSNSTTQTIASLLQNQAANGSKSSGSSSTSGNIAGAQQSLAGDQTTFLKLLTTQLKNQDPTSPMNTDQFTQQLVAMTGVQQQILSNQLLQQLVGNQTGVGDPVNLLGKSVTATSNAANLQGGQANWQFSTAANATDLQVQVTNNFGQVVSLTDLGALGAGAHAFSWNGKDQNGVQLPDGGPYTLAVAGLDSTGAAITTSVFQQGVVSAVDNTGGQVLLSINGSQVPANAITSVQATQ